MDAGSIPATSTNSRTYADQRGPLEPNEYAGFTQRANRAHQVPSGPDGAPKRHISGTNDTIGARERSKISYALDLANPEKHPLLTNFLSPIFLDLSALTLELSAGFRAETLRTDYETARVLITDLHRSLVRKDLNLADPDSDHRDFAHRMAGTCTQTMREHSPQETALSECLRLVSNYNLKPPVSYPADSITTITKLTDWHWWHRTIRKEAARELDQISRALKTVNRVQEIYVSDRTADNHARKKLRVREYLEETVIQNELGKELSLAEVADHSLSNPSIRRAELMTRMRGFEEVSHLKGDQGLFITMTAPSRMHAAHSDGRANAKYDGSTPADTQAYFQSVWARVRASLSRANINVYGFRIAEPHHDGTPHWHFLLFVSKHHHQKLKAIFNRYGLATDPDEPGAQTHRIKYVNIDPSKGSAAGYVAKYVAKNVDGTNIDQDLYDRKAHASAKRIEAWSRTWSIRQFQQVGGPPVGVWRELRRIRGELHTSAEPARQARLI